MVVFYRGRFCSICRTYLRSIDRKADDFSSLGVSSILACSGDSKEEAEATVKEWELQHLTIGYGVTIAEMRRWGLFISKKIKPEETDIFGEPGLFLIRPDGILYYSAINSMPWGRPAISELLAGLENVIKKNYPPRGEA